MKLKDLLYVTTFGTKVVLFVFENGAMKPRIEFVVGEQPKEYDDFNIRSVDLIGYELHLRVSNKETAQEVLVQEQPSQIIININSLTIDSKFADYLYKCLISYQYQLHKSSHPHH